MATKKEAIVILLDVGKSISSSAKKNSTIASSLEDAIKAVNLLVQGKLLFGKGDEVGLVLFGTKGTQNALATDEDAGYQNITVVKDISPPDLDLLRNVEAIEPGNAEGDLLDALIVGMDMLIRRQQEDVKKKWNKRIFLVTDAGYLANEDDLQTVIDQFNRMSASLNVIGVDFSPELENDDAMDIKLTPKQQNEKLLREMTKKVEGVVVPLPDALDMMSYYRSKSVLQRPCFRGDLEISRGIKIPIFSFIKTMEAKFPSLFKVSAVSQQSAEPRSMGVAIERSYHNIVDPDTEIPSEQRIKGYKYGKSLVPFDKVDESVLKYEASQCLKLIGFTSAKKVPRYHFMGNVECMVSIPGDEVAAKALSGVIHALAETESVAIVRYVKTNRSMPQLGVLFPHIKPQYECLYYSKLPFTEDIRQYPFAPLSPNNDTTKRAFIPNEEQKRATEELINSLDLMEAAVDDQGNKVEALKPKYTFNVAIQRFYQCVHHRALHPNAPLPKTDPLLEKHAHPEKELYEKATPSLKRFRDAFPLQKSDQVKDKADRIYWKDSLLANKQVKLDSYVPDPSKKQKLDKADLTMEAFISNGVSEVGAIQPVEDFKEMLHRRDIDLVDKAIDGMKKRITQLVNDSILDQLYGKALNCVIALREGCVQEDEFEEFNHFLRELRTLYEGKRKDDFWRLIVKKNVTLIDSDECADSSVSPAEAKKFLAAPQQAPSLDTPQLSKDDDSADDLFAMVE